MQRGNASPLLAIEYLLRVSGWVFAISAEAVGNRILGFLQGYTNYYGILIALAAIICLAIQLLGDFPVIRDLQELCLYDLFVQIYGLGLSLAGISSASFLIAAIAIYLLKFIRVMWWGRNLNGELISQWPVFGIIGYFDKKRVQEPISAKQRAAIFATIALTFVAALFIWLFFERVPTFVMYVVVVVCILIFTKRAALDIQRRDEERITAIRELERAKVIAEFNADAAARNEDLRGATHDLNNPVWAMSFTAREIANAPDLDTAKAIAQNMEAGLHDLTDMIVEVVEMARLGTKLATPLDNVILMPEICRHFNRELGALARERSIRLGFDDVPIAVRSNEWLFKRIIHNLLMNAIVHGNKRTYVKLAVRQCGQFCYLRVWDTGPGIPGVDGPDRAANFKNLIFTTRQEKSSEHNPVSQRVTGHGLGLRGVMRMANTLGLEITMRSRVGVGTMFRFKVPIAAMDDLPDF